MKKKKKTGVKPKASGYGDAGASIVKRALRRMPEKYRVPVYLHIVEGYTILEIAKMLHLPPGTAATAVRRGRKLLKEAFDEEAI